jgi:hypothetical protein
MATKKKVADDKLTSTAKAIGTTLGTLAVKVGIVTPPPQVKKKATKKAPAKSLVKKTATKRAPKKAK